MGIQKQQKLLITDAVNKRKLADAARYRLSLSKSDSEKSSVRDKKTIAMKKARAKKTDEEKTGKVSRWFGRK